MKRLRVKVFLSIFLLLMSIMVNRGYAQNEKLVNVASLAPLKYNGPGRSDSIFKALFSCKEIIDSIDEEEVIRYYIEMDSLKSACRLVEEYIVGNSSVAIQEYRIFKQEEKDFLLHSKFVGTRSFTSQDEIVVYQYDSSNNKLKEDTSLTQRFTMDFKEFLHPATPDSIKREIELSHDYFYHIVHNEKGVAEFGLYCRYIDNEGCNDHWKIGDRIIFKIEEGRIVKESPSFECYEDEKVEEE